MTTPFRLRPYEHSRDLERCLAIWRAASDNAHTFLGIDQIRADEKIIRERYMPMAEITVADQDGETAGFIALLDGFIGGLFVSPEQHRHGIGKKLVQDAASRKGSLEVEVYRKTRGRSRSTERSASANSARSSWTTWAVPMHSCGSSGRRSARGDQGPRLDGELSNASCHY